MMKFGSNEMSQALFSTVYSARDQVTQTVNKLNTVKLVAAYAEESHHFKNDAPGL